MTGLPDPLPVSALRCAHYTWRGSDPVYCRAAWDEPCRDDQGRHRYRHEQHPRRLCCGLCSVRSDEVCVGPSGKPVPKLHSKHPRIAAAVKAIEAEATAKRMRERDAENRRRFGPGINIGGTWLRIYDPAGAQALAELGLTLGATPEDVARAFREKAKQAHPDAGGTNEAFAALNTTKERALRAVGAST